MTTVSIFGMPTGLEKKRSEKGDRARRKGGDPLVFEVEIGRIETNAKLFP